MPPPPPTIVIPYTLRVVQPMATSPRQIFVARPEVKTQFVYCERLLRGSFPSLIDSGADHCVFPARFGEAVGISVRRGEAYSAIGIGEDVAYFHRITVYVQLAGKVYHFTCTVGFMAALDRTDTGLLGRHGFFELFDAITFKHRARLVELVPRS
ncbi:MAG: hypothetical protein HY597_07005 [Candidatus Omnitrophica bacterium]|nr:hypothetical protein [Candidatus Omnitrophota bacterium]